jgi:predicted  nucleic acid-binding Zn-ribbon protein
MPLESTDTLYRFEESLPGNSSKDLLVKEEITSGQGIQILPMDTMQIEQYFRTAEIPDSVKKSLQEAARLKYALIDIDRQIQERRQTIGEITQEQTRIRENMKAVSASSDYYKRLEKELDAQETQIQKLKSEAKDLGEKRTVQQKALEDYLENLSVG